MRTTQSYLTPQSLFLTSSSKKFCLSTFDHTSSASYAYAFTDLYIMSGLADAEAKVAALESELKNFVVAREGKAAKLTETFMAIGKSEAEAAAKLDEIGRNPAGFSGQFPIENEYAEALKQEQEVAKGLGEAREVVGRHTSAEGATNADVMMKLAEMSEAMTAAMTAGFAALETKLDQRLGEVERRVAQVEESRGARIKVRDNIAYPAACADKVAVRAFSTCAHVRVILRAFLCKHTDPRALSSLSAA